MKTRSSRGAIASLTASLLLALVFAGPLAAQDAYVIAGTARDAATGSGIGGAQVSLGDTGYGTITENTGRYTLRAPVSAGTYTLRFTYLGRETATLSVDLAGDRTVRVQDVYLAETALELAEIVVTGTAAPTARRAIGNAVSTVSAQDLERSAAVTIDQALQGKVAGALITSNTGTPGGGVSVRLRGTSSIIAGAEPLYIVDGVVVDNSSDQIINFGYRSNPSNRLADLDPADIERIEILKGAAAAALYGSRANNGVVQIFTKRGRTGAPRITVSTQMKRASLPSSLPWALTPVDTDGNTVTRYNHEELIFRDAWSNETHASVSGGFDDTNYYVSAGYTGEQGIMIGSDYDKYNVRMNLDQNLGDRLSVSASTNYIRSENDLVINGEQGVGGLLTGIVFTPTTVDLAERNPETGELVNNAFVFPNPLAVVEDWETPQDVSRFVGSFLMRVNPFDRMNLRYSFGYDSYSMETALFIPRESQLDPLGTATSAHRNSYLINNDLVASYEWGAAGTGMNTTVGMNHTHTSEENLFASASDLSPLTTLVRGAVQSASESLVETTTLGFFAQQQVEWGDRLFLTGALRWDASSTFGEDERWHLYPKLSGSWLLSEEDWFSDWFHELRLRGAYGEAGNQPSKGSAYARFARYFNTINVDRLGLVHSGNAGNPDLKPERQREIEVGFDASLYEDRFGISYTYYDQHTDDLLLTRPFAPSTGFGGLLANVGELDNTGHELELNATVMDRGDFRWSSSLIWSKNNNEVTRLEGGEEGSFQVGYNNWIAEGHELGVFRMPAFERDANGNIVTDDVGPVLASERKIVGSPWPDWTGSLRNEFRWGGHWSSSFLLDAQWGHEVWNQTQRIMDIFGAGPLYDQLLRGEITPAYRSRIQGIWEAYLEDASFIKLRDVSITYRTSDAWVERMGLQSVQFELMGRDLYTWTDYSGYDPEVNMFGLSTVARGVDFAVYPHPRTLSFGVQVVY